MDKPTEMQFRAHGRTVAEIGINAAATIAAVLEGREPRDVQFGTAEAEQIQRGAGAAQDLVLVWGCDVTVWI